MGQIADDMIEGRACELCGQYFEDPDEPDAIYEHGHPVVCEDCWNELSPRDRHDFQKASVNTF